MEVEEDEIESSPSSSTSQAPPPSPPQQPEPPLSPSLQPQPPSAQTLTLALPIQQSRPSPTTTTAPPPAQHSSHGREDCWSEGATSTLIDAWGERYLELSRGNLKHKHWKDVADILTSRDDYTKTDAQCKNRIDSLKKKYKTEKNKIGNNANNSKWGFYDRLHHLIVPNANNSNSINKHANVNGSVGGEGKVPLAIPVHLVRNGHPNLNSNSNHHQQQQRQQRGPYKEQKPMDSDSSGEEPVYDDDSPDSTDSLPPETDYVRKRPRLFARRACPTPTTNSVLGGSGVGGSYRERNRSSGKKRSHSSSGGDSSNRKNSIMELTRAIMKFGEAYDQIETSKIQQVVEMEQQRMEFMKELELQRMQFFMKTQMDLSQVKHGRRGGNGRRHNNNSNNNIDNGDNSG